MLTPHTHSYAPSKYYACLGIQTYSHVHATTYSHTHSFSDARVHAYSNTCNMHTSTWMLTQLTQAYSLILSTHTLTYSYSYLRAWTLAHACRNTQIHVHTKVNLTLACAESTVYTNKNNYVCNTCTHMHVRALSHTHTSPSGSLIQSSVISPWGLSLAAWASIPLLRSSPYSSQCF